MSNDKLETWIFFAVAIDLTTEEQGPIKKFRLSSMDGSTLEIHKLSEKHADRLRDRKRGRETIGESEIRYCIWWYGLSQDAREIPIEYPKFNCSSK